MKPLSNKQSDQIGASYVLNMLSPLTPYGKDAARAIAPFARNEADKLAEELDNVEVASSFSRLKPSFSDFSHLLAKFRDIRGSLKKLDIKGRVLGDVELFELKNFLLTLGETAEYYKHFTTSANLNNINLRSMTEALKILDPDGTRLRSFYISEKYSGKLREIRERKKNIEQRINMPSNKANLSELEHERSRIVTEEENEELEIRTELTKQISAYKNEFDANIKNLAKLDLTLAKVELSVKYNCAKPSISENTINLKNVYSPETAAALKERGKEVTPVSIELASGTAVLTGANMGGKSIALKTLALTAYLFQCGLPVFAESAALPMFDHLDFIFEDEQSIHSGLSSFGAEMVHINSMLDHAENSFSLIILDEPAKGTNPKEGRAIAAGLAAYLNKLPSVSILSTHYDNVAAKQYNCYMAAGLCRERINAGITPNTISELMDYRLIKNTQTSAVSGSNDAVTICRLLRVNSGLLKLIESELN